MGYAATLFAPQIEQAINTKEDVEILESLFAGSNAYVENHALRCVKLSKIIDLI